jgi:hypothetical protein
MRILASSALIFLSGLVSAQATYTIGVQAGIGSYSMRDLREFQGDQEFSWNQVDVETIDEFPSYYYYDVWVTRSFYKKLELGISYRLQSTGYKSHYADYSGELLFEQTLVANQIGVLAATPVAKILEDRLVVSLAGNIYYCRSSDNFNYRISFTNGPGATFNETLVSNSVVLNAAARVSYTIVGGIRLGASAGYSIDSGGTLHQNGQTDAVLETEPSTNWSGMRLGLTCEYVLGKKQDK